VCLQGVLQCLLCCALQCVLQVLAALPRTVSRRFLLIVVCVCVFCMYVKNCVNASGVL